MRETARHLGLGNPLERPLEVEALAVLGARDKGDDHSRPADRACRLCVGLLLPDAGLEPRRAWRLHEVAEAEPVARAPGIAGALKAQGQCRATLETLAAIKNPPVVFARQANINAGGQQQVNNGPMPNSPRASARPGETASAPNELLEDATHGSAQLDIRATAAAGRTNQGMEPVGAFNRAANR